MAMLLGTANKSQSGVRGQTKKWGPRLGSGAPEGAFQLLASFSRQRVGSSILASLSEAGGNDLPRATSKPLPPRLSFPTVRQTKRAYAPELMHGPSQLKTGKEII